MRLVEMLESVSRSTTTPAGTWDLCLHDAARPPVPGGCGAGKRPSNQRLKLAACGRRLRRKAQGKLFVLIAAPSGRSLSAVR